MEGLTIICFPHKAFQVMHATGPWLQSPVLDWIRRCVNHSIVSLAITPLLLFSVKSSARFPWLQSTAGHLRPVDNAEVLFIAMKVDRRPLQDTMAPEQGSKPYSNRGLYLATSAASMYGDDPTFSCTMHYHHRYLIAGASQPCS